MSRSPQQLINESPMSGAQIMAILVCILLNMMDGFDILIMAFTASSVSAHWSLDNSQLGLLLSAGLFGMAAGALFLAPYADKFGRKGLILLCTLIMGLGMIFSGYAPSPEVLVALRFVTGIGIGGMIASLNTLVSEHANDKNRGFAVSVLQTGNPIGGVLGGMLAVFLIGRYGWEVTFIVGGIATLALLPLVVWKLPESVSFLERRRPNNALQKINTILRNYGHEPVDALPDNASSPADPSAGKQGIMSLFQGESLQRSLLLGLSFFMIMFSFYFVMSWTPKLLVQAGLSTSAGISGAIILNLGGIIGAPVLGYLSAKRGLQTLIAGYMVATALFMAVFGFVTANFVPALFVALLLGFFLFGSIIGLYALAPRVYEVENRAAGIGFAIGVGRIGAVVAPIVAGVVLDQSLPVYLLFILFALPMLVCTFSQKKISLLSS